MLRAGDGGSAVQRVAVGAEVALEQLRRGAAADAHADAAAAAAAAHPAHGAAAAAFLALRIGTK